ncbi:MAG TPA: hypothetical protein VL027_03810 [Spongiibacteraceae bacterium]|nr:hypothetical protein [Spongiibacteraceae bacterium]
MGRWLRCWPGLWSMLVLGLAVPGALHAEPAPLARYLGVDAALQQIAPLTRLSLAGGPLHDHLDAAQRAQVETQVVARLAAEPLRAAVEAALRELPDSARATTLLAAELPQRVRNFDQVFGVDGAPEKFRDYRRQLAAQPPRAARRALIAAIDTSSDTSAHAAWLQTAVEDCAARHAAAVAGTAPALAPREQRLSERETALRDMAVDLSLYSYRFLRDEELQQYLDLLRQPAVRSARETAWQALRTALSQLCAQ